MTKQRAEAERLWMIAWASSGLARKAAFAAAGEAQEAANAAQAVLNAQFDADWRTADLLTDGEGGFEE